MDYQIYKQSVETDIKKILLSPSCGSILEKALEINFIDFYMLDFNDRNEFRKRFSEAILIIKKLDLLFELVVFKEFMQEIKGDNKSKKVRTFILQTKLLAIPYCFYKVDSNYCFDFIKAFIKPIDMDEIIARYQPVLEILTSVKVNNPQNYKEIIEAIVSEVEEQGYKFPLNFLHYVNFLDFDDKHLVEFMKYLRKNGLRLKIKHKFKELGI